MFTHMANSCKVEVVLKTDVTPAILTRDFVAKLYRPQNCTVQLCVLHTATLSHKQQLTNRHSLHFRDKVAQNRALHCSEKELCDC